jgi:hypothetical protein
VCGRVFFLHLARTRYSLDKMLSILRLSTRQHLTRRISTPQTWRTMRCLVTAAEKRFSETLQLPHTEFPLRANAAQRDAEFRDRCTHQLYQWQASEYRNDRIYIHSYIA